NDVGNGLADRTRFGHRLLALFNTAAVAHRENEYFAPVPLRRQKRQGRSLAHDHPAGQLIRSRSGYAPVFLKHRCGVVEWMDYKSGQYLRTELVKPELECGDNAEVSAAHVGPKTNLVFVRASSHQATVRRYHVGRNKVVDRESKFACDPTE